MKRSDDTPTNCIDSAEAGRDALPLSLTDRRREVLNLAANGLSDREIGAKLGISRQTVRHHLQRTREAFGARNTVQAVALAIRNQII